MRGVLRYVICRRLYLVRSLRLLRTTERLIVLDDEVREADESLPAMAICHQVCRDAAHRGRNPGIVQILRLLFQRRNNAQVAVLASLELCFLVASCVCRQPPFHDGGDVHMCKQCRQNRMDQEAAVTIELAQEASRNLTGLKILIYNDPKDRVSLWKIRPGRIGSRPRDSVSQRRFELSGRPGRTIDQRLRQLDGRHAIFDNSRTVKVEAVHDSLDLSFPGPDIVA